MSRRETLTLPPLPKFDGVENTIRAERSMKLDGYLIEEWLVNHSGECLTTVDGRPSRLNFDDTVKWIVKEFPMICLEGGEK